MLFDAKSLSKITGQTETAVHAIARHLPLESESIGAGIKRHFSPIDAVTIVACWLLRRCGLPPAMAADIGTGLHPQFVKIAEDPSYRPFLFAAPTPAHTWLTTAIDGPSLQTVLIGDSSTAIYVNVAELKAEAEQEISRYG